MQECDEQRFMPAIQYYQLFGEPGGGESATLQKVQNATTMRSYFGDFKLLMQRAKDFGKPVLVLLEADAFGFLEQQSAGNRNAYAAIAASGMPELAGLPNTVAGWGLAFLQIRKAVGANNAILGIHISGWASGKDVAYGTVTDPLQPEVDKVYNFLAPVGLAANVTGATYDVLVGIRWTAMRTTTGWSRGRTAGGTRATARRSPAGASTATRSGCGCGIGSRSKRWVLWQIPLGNSNHLNVSNDGSARGATRTTVPSTSSATARRTSASSPTPGRSGSVRRGRGRRRARTGTTRTPTGSCS